MRLSRIWRILQIKEGVVHRGRRPKWITLSEICRILHILWKPNSIIALLFIQNISSFLKSFAITLFVFPLIKYNTTLSPGFLGQRFNNLWRAVLLTSLIQYGEDFDVIGSIIFGRLPFWRHWFNIAKILSKFGEQQLVMVNYACGLNQSETGKYFEWIIMKDIGIWFGLTHLHIFRALCIGFMFLFHVLIGSLICLCSLWSVLVISLVLDTQLKAAIESLYTTWLRTVTHGWNDNLFLF